MTVELLLQTTYHNGFMERYTHKKCHREGEARGDPKSSLALLGTRLRPAVYNTALLAMTYKWLSLPAMNRNGSWRGNLINQDSLSLV